MFKYLISIWNKQALDSINLHSMYKIMQTKDKPVLKSVVYVRHENVLEINVKSVCIIEI